MRRGRKVLRPQIKIKESAYSKSHGHTYQYVGYITPDGAHGGLCCTECGSFQEAITDYWSWLWRLNYKLILSDGKEYYPKENYPDSLK